MYLILIITPNKRFSNGYALHKKTVSELLIGLISELPGFMQPQLLPYSNQLGSKSLGELTNKYFNQTLQFMPSGYITNT